MKFLVLDSCSRRLFRNNAQIFWDKYFIYILNTTVILLTLFYKWIELSVTTTNKYRNLHYNVHHNNVYKNLQIMRIIYITNKIYKNRLIGKIYIVVVKKPFCIKFSNMRSKSRSSLRFNLLVVVEFI